MRPCFFVAIPHLETPPFGLRPRTEQPHPQPFGTQENLANKRLPAPRVLDSEGSSEAWNIRNVEYHIRNSESVIRLSCNLEYGVRILIYSKTFEGARPV